MPVGVPGRHYCISTLDLAKRSTRDMCAIEIFSIISTLDLTKRSTFQLREMNLTETFQLTTSRRGRHYRRSQSHIPISISTHDLTKRSTLIPCHIIGISNISTHDLTKRSTTEHGTLQYESRGISTHDLTKRSTVTESGSRQKSYKFQLTTSRRGRPHETQHKIITIPFQLTTSRRGRLNTRLVWYR